MVFSAGSTTTARPADHDASGPGGATARHDDTPARRAWSVRDLVLGSAVLMVVAHLALRTWMLWPAWFYCDDYVLLGQAEAQGSGLSGDYLAEPYAGRFMPIGRALTWVVAQAGVLDWHVTALIILALVALADLACVWMLLELFGARRGVLLPLILYLTTAIVVPGTMWWAAAFDQLPLQVTSMAAIAAWVRYLRTRRTRWLVVAALAVTLGLVAFVKGLLVLVVLAWLALAHFSSGGPRQRVVDAARRWWGAIAVLGAVAAAYAVFYVTAVPGIVNDGRRAPVALDLASTMLGQALPVGLLGGPWRWQDFNLPVPPADPPASTVVLSWVVLLAVAAGLALRRRRTGRVWALLGVYVAIDYVLLLTTRAPLLGGIIGLEYRYLMDAAPVAVLCLGLLTMPLRGASEPTEPREDPPLRVPDRLLTRLPVVAAVALTLSSLVSTVGYARIWHTENPADPFFSTVRAELDGRGTVDVAEASVPEDVVSALVSPWNTLSRLLPLAGLDVAFPEVSTRLGYVDGEGRLSAAFVDPVVLGVTPPDDGCGYRLDDDQRTVTVPLEREVPAGIYWLRAGFLSSAADTVRVSAGDANGDAQVSKGLGSVFVDIGDGADAVTFTLVGEGTTVCIGDVQAGPLVAGGAW